MKLYAVFRKEHDDWVFVKAFTSLDSAANAIRVSEYYWPEQKIVTYLPLE